MTIKELKQEAEALGYSLHSGVRSYLDGNTYRWSLMPQGSGHPTYHNDKGSIERRINWIKTVRSWQEDK